MPDFCLSPTQPATLPGTLEAPNAFGTGLVNGDDPLELLSPDGWTFSDAMSQVGDTIVCDPNDPTGAGAAVQELGPEYQPPGDPNFLVLPLYLTVVIDSITQGRLELAGTTGFPLTTAGTHYVPCATTSGTFRLDSYDNCDAVISSVSFKLLNDSQLGPELCVNGSFSTDSDWTYVPDGALPVPFIIAGGVLSVAPDDGGWAINSTGPMLDQFEMYKLVLTVSNYAEFSQLNPFLETASEVFNSGFTTINPEDNGTFTGTDVALDSGRLTLYCFGQLSVDNVSLKKYVFPV